MQLLLISHHNRFISKRMVQY